MLVVDGVEVRYGGVRAVRGVSLDIAPGRMVGVVGPNGAGKSSLLRAIVGAVRPSAGHITWEGRSLRGRRPHELARSGVVLVPEGRGLLRSLSVAENLAVARFAGRTGDFGAARDEMLALFPALADRLGQPAGSLSGGQQQMLVIARALLMRPELLLIDELSLGLAPRVVHQVYEVLRRRNADGLTIMVVEQHLPNVTAVAHQLYAIARGEVVAAGPPAEVAGQLTRSFGEAVPAGRTPAGNALEEARP